jgi:hypothetical protein
MAEEAEKITPSMIHADGTLLDGSYAGKSVTA